MPEVSESFESNVSRLRKAIGRIPHSRQIYRECRIAVNTVARFLNGSIAPAFEPRIRARRLAWDVSQLDASSIPKLQRSLEQRGIQCRTGTSSVYVPPQPGLHESLGECVRFYPPSCGFKFYPVPDGSAMDASAAIERFQSAAAVLYYLGLGPRLYDVADYRFSPGPVVGFAIEHVDGAAPDGDRRTDFKQQLHTRMQDEFGAESAALLSVDDSALCNGDLRMRVRDGRLLHTSPHRLLTVDSTRLVKTLLNSCQEQLHFGSIPMHCRGRYLYQSVPGFQAGKRDISYRWLRYQRILQRAGVSLEGRVLLDICCNAAVFLGIGLSSGAPWGFGWDLPEIAAIGQKLQMLLGNTRIDVFGTRLTTDYPLSADLPQHIRPHLDGAVVLFLSAWRYVGFMNDLAEVPWKALIYEGHEKDTPEETARNYDTMQRKWNCRLVYSGHMADGHCSRRPLALFLRN